LDEDGKTEVQAIRSGSKSFTRIGLALLASCSQALMNAPVASSDLNYFLRRIEACVGGLRKKFAEYMRSSAQVRKLEHILLLTGLVFLAVWMAAQFHQIVGSKAAIARFESESKKTGTSVAPFPDPDLSSPVDFSLWSPGRVTAYKDSLAQKSDAPLAILRISKIHLEVPVFNDTDDLTLNRGVGRILGTGQIGKPGNLGIAGHRDGFFRGLQNIGPGDSIEIVQHEKTDKYVVSEIRIVTPEDVHVLDPTPKPTLTLVTCFPFYFVGHAPKRYIVTAVLASTDGSDLSGDGVGISKGKNTN
jgi:sortase A